MKPALPKPEYEPVTPAARSRLGALYQNFADRNATAWHTAYGELYELQNNGRRKSKNHPQVFDQVWGTYDLVSRSVIYLWAANDGQLTRSALQSARTNSHPFSLTEINTQIARFPQSMFNYHCDLPMSNGDHYPLRKPQVSGCKIECVIPDFAYYFVSASRGREYCTLVDDQLYLLETTDYDGWLEHDWDGKCEYIQ